MAKFQTYEKYAYSDYFKAELPAEWMEKRLSYISAYDRNSFVDGPFGSDLKSSDYKESGVPLIQLNNIRDGKHVLQNYKFITEKKRVELSRHVALPNDIVIAKMAEPVARSAIVSDKYPEYVIVADCVKLSPDLSLINLNFLNWAINSDLVKMNAELVSSGTTRIRISLGELKKLKIPYPSLIEQQAIANFLDHETAKIDTLIDKQKTLIRLLQEKRQAVISHAVTKGLNPDAPMKDSGAEWLGEVPEHWEVQRLKYITTHNDEVLSEKTKNEYEIQYVDIGSVSAIDGIVDINKMSFETAPSRARRLVKDGDIIVSTVRTYLKAIAPIINPPINLVVSTGFAVIRPTEGLYKDYASYFLRSNVFIANVVSRSVGVSYPAINSSDLVDIYICKPEYEEQIEISSYLAKQSEKIDDLIVKAGQQIELMKERRTALISAAVTGKIDVRGWQAPE